MSEQNIVINKENGEQLVFETKDKLENYFTTLFKDLYNNPDNYDDVERNSAHEIISFFERKKINDEVFVELLKNEKDNLSYFWYGLSDITVGDIKIELKY